jgi:hypothetical protein
VFWYAHLEPEALVRVMVEAETDALVTEAMDALILRITAEA